MANNLPKSKLIHEVIAEQDAIILGKTVLKESGKSLVADTEIAKIHAPNSDNETASSIATIIDGTDAKTPLVDTDTFPLTEPTTLKKTLWSTIKSTLKTYFDGLYLKLTGGTLTGDLILGQKAIFNNIGTAVADNSPFVIETAYDLANSATTALYIYPKDSNNHRIYFGRNASSRNIYELTMTGMTSITGMPSIMGLQGAGSNADQMTFGSTILGTGIRRRGNTFTDGSRNEVDIFASDSGSYGCAINFFLSPTAYYSVNQKNLTGLAMRIDKTLRIGIGTSAPDKQLEINSADGNNLRLTYNDSNGGAANYVDFLVSSSGDLIITPSGGDIEIGSANIHTTGALKGVHKANDGTNAVADGTYTVGIGTTTNGTITIKDGIITAVQQAT